eukprot:611281_1
MYDSHLATIEDDLSAQVLLDGLSFCTDEHLWIGLNDQAVEGTWEYADGTACPGCATSPYWHDDEPNNVGNEDCAEVYLRSTIYNMLNDVICTNDRAFACNKPTAYPIAYPTAYPTAHPSTAHPTAHPTVHPTTTRPTIHPTVHPATVHPTSHPTTASPTVHPSVSPTTTQPTIQPSTHPTTANPTAHPITAHPTLNPTIPPTVHPTVSTVHPTNQPTFAPITAYPTVHPTTVHPTVNPSIHPTTTHPTIHPTMAPTTAYPTTAYPTLNPTISLTSANPTVNPTIAPTTVKPTVHPITAHPTLNPTITPTTGNPTVNPTIAPTTVKPQSMYDSHLATIEDDLSAQALLDGCSFCTDDFLWMGLNDQAVEGTWEYADGTACPGCATSPYWNDGEPNNSPGGIDGAGDEDCAGVYIAPGYTIYNMLNDGICTNDRAFACNKPTADVLPFSINSDVATVTQFEMTGTVNPTIAPTSANPTVNPTIAPTTVKPTVNPTIAPTSANPTVNPTIAPTTVKPTVHPITAHPTLNPTITPTTGNPTVNPTIDPTPQPTPYDNYECDEIPYILVIFFEITTDQDDFEDELVEILITVMTNTIKSLIDVQWNGDWCINLIKQNLIPYGNRRRLLQDTVRYRSMFNMNKAIKNDVFDNADFRFNVFKKRFADNLKARLSSTTLIQDEAGFSMDSVTDIEDIAENTTTTKSEPFFDLTDPLMVSLMILVGFSISIMISGKIHARYSDRDDFRLGPVFLFSIYVWDFYTDLLFAMSLYTTYVTPDTIDYMVLFVAS